MLNRYFCMSEPNRSRKLSHLPNRTDINCCGIPNCAILKCGCKAHHAQICTTRQCVPRANAYHTRECVPWGRMRTTRKCVPHADAYHGAECVIPRPNAYHVRSTRQLNSSCNGKSSIWPQRSAIIMLHVT